MKVRARLPGGFAAAAAVLAVLCVGVALPGLADRYGGMAQDLLLRWTSAEDGVGWIWHAALGLGALCSGVLALRAWRRAEIGGLVGYALCSVFLLGSWVFVPEFLQAWVWMDPEPGWVQ